MKLDALVKLGVRLNSWMLGDSARSVGAYSVRGADTDWAMEKPPSINLATFLPSSVFLEALLEPLISVRYLERGESQYKYIIYYI